MDDLLEPRKSVLTLHVLQVEIRDFLEKEGLRSMSVRGKTASWSIRRDVFK